MHPFPPQFVRIKKPVTGRVKRKKMSILNFIINLTEKRRIHRTAKKWRKQSSIKIMFFFFKMKPDNESTNTIEISIRERCISEDDS